MTYRVIFSRTARRAIEQHLPEKVATAALQFIAGALADNPYRVGKPLREPFKGRYSARRGDYRVIYEIFEQRVVIEIVSLAHRRDAYRP